MNWNKVNDPGCPALNKIKTPRTDQSSQVTLINDGCSLKARGGRQWSKIRIYIMHIKRPHKYFRFDDDGDDDGHDHNVDDAITVKPGQAFPSLAN